MFRKYSLSTKKQTGEGGNTTIVEKKLTEF